MPALAVAVDEIEGAGPDEVALDAEGGEVDDDGAGADVDDGHCRRERGGRGRLRQSSGHDRASVVVGEGRGERSSVRIM